MLGSNEMWKRIYAEDVAIIEGFEWDFQNASDDELYEALGVCGWEWDDETTTWIGPE